MSESKKQQIIRDIYFDKGGYGSRKTTLEDAKKKEPTIKKEDVEQFFRKNVEIKAKPRGHNSFVAPHNNYLSNWFVFYGVLWFWWRIKNIEEDWFVLMF